MNLHFGASKWRGSVGFERGKATLTTIKKFLVCELEKMPNFAPIAG